MPRLGGAFPFSLPDINHGGGVVVLTGGQAFYPPAGNYMWGPGNQTCLQWFDPILGGWRTLQQPDSGPTNFNADGYNWRLINMSGVVAGATITNAGSGGTNGIGAAATSVSLTFAPPTGTGLLTAVGYPIVGGSVAAPTITQAGSGFLQPPLIFCDPPPYGGIQATFSCTLNAGGGLATVTVVNPGAGYLQSLPPNFYIVPQTQFYQGAPSGGVAAAPLIPPGLINPLMAPQGAAPGFQYGTGSTGALLSGNANTGSGTLTGIGMIINGTGYTGTTISAITISGCGAAAATAVMSMCMTGSNGLAGGSGYTGTAPNWETSLGLITNSLLNGVLMPRCARGVTTLSGAGAVNGIVIEDPGFGLQKVPVAGIYETGALAGGLATFTPVCGGQTDTNQLQSRIYA